MFSVTVSVTTEACKYQLLNIPCIVEVLVKGTGDLTKKLQSSSQNKASGIQILMK